MRRRVILPLLLALLFAAPVAHAAQVKFGNASVHDPSVLYADGKIAVQDHGSFFHSESPIKGPALQGRFP